MRSPEQDDTLSDGDDSVSSALGEGFNSSSADTFGEDDFADDDFSDAGFGEDDDDFSVDDVDVDTDEDADQGDGFGDGQDGESDGGFDLPGEDGDSLTDDEASNVLEEILEDLFGDDGPEALDETESDSAAFTMVDNDDLAMDGDDGGFDDAFDPTDLPSKDDFDLNRDGQVDHHDGHEITHPFDFGGS